MTYRIRIAKPEGLSAWHRLPPWARREFRGRWPLLRQNPYRGIPGQLDVHQYSGRFWTMRVGVYLPGGGYRGIYEVVGDEIRFLMFGPRPVAYREMGKFRRR